MNIPSIVEYDLSFIGGKYNFVSLYIDVASFFLERNEVYRFHMSIYVYHEDRCYVIESMLETFYKNFSSCSLPKKKVLLIIIFTVDSTETKIRETNSYKL